MLKDMTSTTEHATPREVPAPVRGSGPVTCCGGHRERCIISHGHVWGTWYENGRLQRTSETLYCHRCDGVCTADENVVEDEEDGGRCDGCSCCTAQGCHRGADSECPYSNEMLRSLCPCTED